LEASIAAAVWAAAKGVGMVRVHDVRATVAAVRIVSEQVSK
jgi:dihydropteroate synthase